MFSLIVGIMIFHMHMSLSHAFITQETISLSFLNKPLFVIPAAAIKIVKLSYMAISFVSIYFICFTFYRTVFERFFEEKQEKTNIEEIESNIPPFPYDDRKLQIVVGLKHNKFNLEYVKNPEYLIIPEIGMYQNFLIAGTIGSGKTAAVMYPFLKQILYYEADNKENKAGMLILDVKGNFYKKVLEYAREAGREQDTILIGLEGDNKYNPLYKPNMEPIDLASRSRAVIELFSAGSKKDKFWDTKAQQMMTECIRLMRMVKGYVSLADIHSIVTNDEFLQEKLSMLQNSQGSSLNVSNFDFNACLNYFYGEFQSKAENTISTIKACVTEMTGFFTSSERIHTSFCPEKRDVTFTGFEECINKGKIVVLAMNVAQYPQVSRTIAAYLKLDFQSEVQQRTSKTGLNKNRPVFFICDEYQEFVNADDARFYGLSRESKCCSIVSSQSYNSIIQTLGDQRAFDTLQQNLLNKIWLRTDDKFTIEAAQFLTGKEEKEKYSKNISESLTDAKKSKLFGRLTSDKASLSESINLSTHKEAVFDEKIFTQTLELFKAICYSTNETGVNEPYLIHLLPFFKSPILDIKATKSPSVVRLRNSIEKQKKETQKWQAENRNPVVNMREIIEKERRGN